MEETTTSTSLLQFSNDYLPAGEDTAGLSSEPQHSTVKITLNFKRFIFDPQKKMIQ